ncbi:MAG: hypothetical protein AB7U29_20350 [Desulfobulbus sp.]
MQAIIEALGLLGIMGAGFGTLSLIAIVNGRAFRREQAEKKILDQKQEEAEKAFQKA